MDMQIEQKKSTRPTGNAPPKSKLSRRASAIFVVSCLMIAAAGCADLQKMNDTTPSVASTNANSHHWSFMASSSSSLTDYERKKLMAGSKPFPAKGSGH